MKIFKLALAVSFLATIEGGGGPAKNDKGPLKGSVGMDSILLQLVEDYGSHGDTSRLLNEARDLPDGASVVRSVPDGMLLVAGDGRIIIEVTSVEANTHELVMALEDLGATITGCFRLVQGHCSAAVAVADLSTVAASTSVQWISANIAQRGRTPRGEGSAFADGVYSGQRRTLVGSVESEASKAIFADDARRQFNVDGTGVKVCVLSDSFNKAVLATDGVTPIKTRAADDVDLGDLPPFERMDIVRDDDITPASQLVDEGRAMMQLIHDVAPGANLGFYTAFLGLSAFADGIVQLVGSGCNVIVDDVIYLEEAMFQDDLVAQAADFAHDQGVAYFSVALNYARQSLEAVYCESAAGINGLTKTMIFEDGLGGTIPFLTVEIRWPLFIVMQYDQATATMAGLPGPVTDMDIYLFKTGTLEIVYGGDDDNLLSGRPSELPLVLEPGTYDIVVQRFTGPQPGLVKFLFQEDIQAVNFHPKLLSSGTSYGHPNARGAIAVGAAAYPDTPGFGVSPAIQAPISSAGGVPILFDRKGERLAIPEVRNVPAFVSVTDTCTNFFGDQDWYNTGDPNCFNFYGTSASAPVAAAVAALMLQANPDLAPDDIRSIMEGSSEDMDDTFTPGPDPGFDFGTGSGFLNGEKAVKAAYKTAKNGIGSKGGSSKGYANKDHGKGAKGAKGSKGGDNNDVDDGKGGMDGDGGDKTNDDGKGGKGAKGVGKGAKGDNNHTDGKGGKDSTDKDGDGKVSKGSKGDGKGGDGDDGRGSMGGGHDADDGKVGGG
jgi:Subtilase family